MALWTIDVISLNKKKYLVEAYTLESALEKMEEMPAMDTIHISDNVIDARMVNLYEYEREHTYYGQKDWIEDVL
jgi:hypothetical protein